jgi:hypothetical protein
MENQPTETSYRRPLELGRGRPKTSRTTRHRRHLVELRSAYRTAGVAVHSGCGHGGCLGCAADPAEKVVISSLHAVPSQPPSAPPWVLWSMGRIGLFAVTAGLPVLSISAHVFGVMPISWAASHVVLPAMLVALVLVLARVPEATVVKRGAAAGLIAVIAYDGTRLPFVLLGFWADFIPRVGGWVVVNEGYFTLHAVLGYTWRYLGNGLGIGVFFFLVCSVFRVRRHLVALAVAYGVFVWSGLMATVVLAEHGQELLFAITPLSVTLSLTGHLVYGLVLGLIMVRFAHRDAVAASSSARRRGGRHRRS